MAKEQKTENKADVISYVIAAEVGAPLIGAAATPDGEHPYIDGRTIVVDKGVVTAIKGEQITDKDAEIENLKSQLVDKDAEIKNLSVQQPHSNSQVAGVRQFLVVKEYCGVCEGEIIISSNLSTIDHMVKNGFWQEK